MASPPCQRRRVSAAESAPTCQRHRDNAAAPISLGTQSYPIWLFNQRIQAKKRRFFPPKGERGCNEGKEQSNDGKKRKIKVEKLTRDAALVVKKDRKALCGRK